MGRLFSHSGAVLVLQVFVIPFHSFPFCSSAWIRAKALASAWSGLLMEHSVVVFASITVFFSSKFLLVFFIFFQSFSIF